MVLEGRTVLLTRARGQNRELRHLLEADGASVVEIPTIRYGEPANRYAVDERLRRLHTYDWIVFTSGHGVDVFAPRCAPPLPRVAVVGIQTARRARSHGIDVAVVPDEFRVEGLLKALPDDMTGVRVLVPRGNLAGDELPDAIRARGARVDTVTVYRTVIPTEGREELRALMGNARVDCVTFTSGSTVRNLMAMLDSADAKESLRRVAIAAIGPVTRQAVEALGLKVSIEPPLATVPSLAEAIRQYFAPSSGDSDTAP